MAGGWRSGRERKTLAALGPLGAAAALVRAVGAQPRDAGRAIHAVPAEMAPRNLRRVISVPNFSFFARLPNSTLSSVTGVVPRRRHYTNFSHEIAKAHAHIP